MSACTPACGAMYDALWTALGKPWRTASSCSRGFESWEALAAGGLAAGRDAWRRGERGSSVQTRVALALAELFWREARADDRPQTREDRAYDHDRVWRPVAAALVNAAASSIGPLKEAA